MRATGIDGVTAADYEKDLEANLESLLNRIKSGSYPALLEAPAPILRAYPPETVVAEKTQAIVSLGIANSRMATGAS